MRRFVAAAVEQTVRAELEEALRPLQARWPEMVWTDPAGWHVTVAFLGELASDRLVEVGDIVGEVLEELPVRKLAFAIDEPVCFGRGILVAQVRDDPAGRTAELGQRLQARLAAAGLPVDRRAVVPHLTLARARRGGGVDPELREAARAVCPSGLTWSLGSIDVWTSHPRRGPARYERDVIVPLPG